MRLARVILVASTSCLVSCASWTKRNDSCTPLPQGRGPGFDLDVPLYFQTNLRMTSISKEAQTPPQWTRSFQGLHASSSGDDYLGYTLLDAYDPYKCAEYCDGKDQCQSINIFFERAPSVKLGPECPNPPSTTLIKCTMWAAPVTETKAKNEGSWDHQFLRLIAGSNAYMNSRAIDPTTGSSPLPEPGQIFEYCGRSLCHDRNGSQKMYRHS